MSRCMAVAHAVVRVGARTVVRVGAHTVVRAGADAVVRAGACAVIRVGTRAVIHATCSRLAAFMHSILHERLVWASQSSQTAC